MLIAEPVTDVTMKTYNKRALNTQKEIGLRFERGKSVD